MQTTTYLIQETRLRQFTDINDSVDTSLMSNAVREAQDIRLQRLLGTTLYRKILADVADDSIVDPYKSLLDDYIEDFLLYAAYYEILEAIYLRPRNNGLLQPSGGENSDPVARDLYNMKRQSVSGKMQFYGDKLTKYLIDFFNDFPELQTNEDLHEQNPDFGSQFKSPIVFQRGTRTYGREFARLTDLPIVDSAFPSYPPPKRSSKY